MKILPLHLAAAAEPRPWFAALLLLFPCACGGGESASLAGSADGAPGVVQLRDARFEALPGFEAPGVELEFDAESGTLLVEQQVGRGDWERFGQGGGFRAPLGLRALDAGSGRLVADELIVDGSAVELERRVKNARPSPGSKRDIGVARGDELIVFTRTGTMPGEARYVERRLVRDASGRVELNGISGPGFAVPRGHRIRLAVPPGPAGSALLQLVGAGEADAPEAWALVSGAEAPRALSAGPQQLALGASREPRTLALEYRGAAAFGALLDPRFVPAGAERGAASSVAADTSDPPATDGARPDVLLFVADTFRADNLRAYAGLPGGVDGPLTPFLDGLLEERAAWFPNAWSPASWTLPAHGSMFTGLYPPEHTADRADRRLPEELERLAERFSAAGYRTVAITDGAYLTPQFGLDRGFDLFNEGPTDMQRTRRLVLEALDDPDPRPRFLFVQTYRTHAPYVAGAAARAETEALLGLGDATFEALEEGLVQNPVRLDQRLPKPISVVHRLRELYRGGAHEFDAEFRTLWDELEQRRFFECGLLAFTSDHGETFAERGEYGHGTALDESQTRIPLLFVGAGATAGANPQPASLVDLGTTLLRWAGLGGAPLGHGRDLLDPAGSAEAVHAYQRDPKGRPGGRATWTASAKWLERGAEGEVLEFALPIDPAVDEGRVVDGSPFAAELTRFEAPRAAAQAVGSLGDEARERLAALGYLDEEPGAED